MFTAILINRRNLTAALKEARRAVLLVEVNDGKATLRSATDLQPTGSFAMPIPYREYCAYTFANGKCISCSDGEEERFI